QVTMPKKPPSRLQSEIDAFLAAPSRRKRSHLDKPPRDRIDKKYDKLRGDKVAMWIAALKKSPAVVVTTRWGGKDLVLRTGEMQNRGEGKLRATMFGTDGPRGHITRNTDRELAEELSQHYAVKSLRPATDAEVMSWTATPEFARGSKLAALTQASNTLRFRGSKTGDSGT